MIEAAGEGVIAAPMLDRRSRFVALVLTYFLSAAGFAYVRRLGLGVIFALLPLVLMFTLGRLGIASTLSGFYVLMGLLGMVLIGSVVTAVLLARSHAAPMPSRWYNRWYHYAWIGLSCVVLMNVVVRHRGAWFGYEPFRIPSSSMQPTLVPGDFVTTDARASSVAHIKREDIVTYVPRAHPDQVRIARVVGLPGETVLARDHVVEINGKRLVEPYLGASFRSDGVEVPFERLTLGADEYFLMGDNRPYSEDSRFQGPVQQSQLRGKVQAIWFSYSPFTHSINTARIGPLPAAHAP